MTIGATLPEVSGASARAVVLVDRDERAGALLGHYLEARGWRVSQVSDARRVVRAQRIDRGLPPLVLLQLDESDTDGYELLGALTARALAARVVVCATGWIDGLASFGVERVLASPCRFSDIATTLEDVRRGFAIRGVR